MEISIETSFEDQVEMNYYFQTTNGQLKKSYTTYLSTAFLMLLLFFLTLRKKEEAIFSILFIFLFAYYIFVILTSKHRIKSNLTKYLSKSRVPPLSSVTIYCFNDSSMNSKSEIMETIVPYSSFQYFTFRKESIYLTLNNGIIYILKWKNSIEKNDLIEELEQISDKNQILIYRNEN